MLTAGAAGAAGSARPAVARITARDGGGEKADDEERRNVGVPVRMWTTYSVSMSFASEARTSR
jgi:hypothetical protein